MIVTKHGSTPEPVDIVGGRVVECEYCGMKGTSQPNDKVVQVRMGTNWAVLVFTCPDCLRDKAESTVHLIRMNGAERAALGRIALSIALKAFK